MIYNQDITKRKIGNGGLEVATMGQGKMTIRDNQSSVDTIRGALDNGVTLFDTADLYGNDGYLEARFGDNEKLLGKALKGRRDEAVIATKFGITHNQGFKGDPAYVK